MADTELQLKIRLAADGLEKDAAAAAQAIRREVGGIESEVVFNANDAPYRNSAGRVRSETDRLVKEAVDGLDQVDGGFKKTSESADQFGGILSGIGAGAGFAAINALGRGLGALRNSFGSAIDLAQATERRLGTLNGVIAATGGVARKTAEDINNLAGQLARDTLTSRDLVLEAAGALLSFRTVTGDVFDRTLVVAQDLAEVLGGNINSQIVQLGKALENPVQGLSALTRTGTVFTQQQKDLVAQLVESGDLLGAQNLILAELEAQYGGAGVAAAQGYAGAIDTLGEALADFQRTLGGAVLPTLTAFTNAASAVIEGFNSLNPAIQKTLILGTGLGALFGAATIAVAAYNTQLVQGAIATATSNAATVTNTAATVANNAAKAIAAAANLNLSAAFAQGVGVINTQTAALLANKDAAIAAAAAKGKAAVAALAPIALTAGVVAGAIVAVGAAFNTLQEVNAPARQAEESISKIGGKLDEIDAAASGAVGAINRLGDDTEPSLNRLQRSLDVVRGLLPGIATAAEAQANKAAIAFSEVSLAVGEVEDKAIRLVGQLNQGLEVDPAVVQATVAGIDEAVKALENQQVASERDAAIRDAQIERLQAYRATVAESTQALGALGDTTEDLANRVKGLTDALTQGLNEIQLATTQARAVVLEAQARGEIDEQEAQKRLGNIERQGLEDRIKANTTKANELRELKAAATDPEVVAKLGAEILKIDQAIANDRAAIAQSLVRTTAQAEKAKTADTKKEEAARRQEAKTTERENTAAIRATERTAKEAARERERVEKEAARAREQAEKEATRAAEEAAKRRLELIRAEGAALVRNGQLAVEAADNQLKAIDRVVDGLSRQGKALAGQLSLLNAIGSLQASVADARRSQLEATIADESKSTAQRRRAAEELIRLTAEQAQAERDRLLQAQTLELQQLDLEQQRTAAAEARAIREQELALAKLELQRLEIENERTLAELRGDDRAVQIAERQISLLGQQQQAQADLIRSLQQEAILSERLGQQQRETLQAQQQQAQQQQAQQQAATARQVQGQVTGTGQGTERRARDLVRGADLVSQQESTQSAQLAQSLSRLLGQGVNPQAQSLVQPGSSQALNLSQFVAPVVAEIQALGTAVEALAASPRQLTVQSPDPVADTSKILSDISRQQRRGAGL